MSPKQESCSPGRNHHTCVTDHDHVALVQLPFHNYASSMSVLLIKKLNNKRTGPGGGGGRQGRDRSGSGPGRVVMNLRGSIKCGEFLD
jgi:hypothetical protein